MIVKLLVLRRSMAHQCATGERQVGTGIIERLINQEVLLLPTQVGVDPGYIFVE